MARNIAIRFPLTAIGGCNNSELARRTGFAVRTIQRWTITYSADRLAIRLGVHPATIWSNWFTV
jgi:hypothetical protein